MHLALIDWIVIVGFLLLTISIGVILKQKAEGNLADFFLGGRSLPWWVAGVSMVATTFAADTPLWVAEVIAQHGISGNWLWWNMLIGGMLTTFFFARLWRRANVITELEFLELRYSGKPAAFLRGFKAAYLGIFMNVIIIGWVNVALSTIFQVFFDMDAQTATYAVIGAMLLVAIYSTMSGLLGVAVTDFFQFTIAMGGCIYLAYEVLQHPAVGGIDGLVAQLPAWRLDFFPIIGNQGDTESNLGTYSIGLVSFFTFAGVQWWASWYPGAEPGGGGYISQRMMSAKDEKQAQQATLFFQIAHYCLRPWPWIIVGLGALLIYPNLPIDEAGKGFVYAMRDILSPGFKGLLLVAFLSAYMSTISTQLNWGASYLTNDIYKRFIAKESSFESIEKADKKYVGVARIATLVIMLFATISTFNISSIDSAAKFLIESGAGTGMVLILRWYWWRISAWSEIAATLSALLGVIISRLFLDLEFPMSLLFTTAICTLGWTITTFLTKPENKSTLQSFYERVTPPGNWSAVLIKKPSNGSISLLILSWLSAVVMTYALLFAIGYTIFKNYSNAIIWFLVSAIMLILLRFSMNKTTHKLPSD